MKVWKLVAGILSIVICAVMMIQSCAAGLVEALEESGGTSGATGMIVAILMLAGGIVSIAVRKSEKNGGNIALIILFGLAALIGFTGVGIYGDLIVWSCWAALNAVMAIIAIIVSKKKR